MRVTCAVSGLRFEVSYFKTVTIDHTEGYFHPIFALPKKNLYQLYTMHCNGDLTATESYLTFLAFLQGSNKVEWLHPATCNPTENRTKQLVQNNIAQLIRIIEKTDVIKHPSFVQPSFKIHLENASLEQIPNWIKAWEENIVFFNLKRADIRERQSLMEVENKLAAYINSGDSPKKYSHAVANWASEAANFPPQYDELWKQTIRSCFSIDKMFKTPLSLLKEIKDYCECNIEAGSIYFHALSEVLKEGISRHVDYLGGSSLALGYIILPTLSTGSELQDRIQEEKNREELLALAAKAPDTEPVRMNYTNNLDYIKAKAAYRMAKSIARKEAKEKAAELRRIELALPVPKEVEDIETTPEVKELPMEFNGEEL